MISWLDLTRSFAVLRRCTATLGLLTVALILGEGPTTASASSVVSELVTTNSSGTVTSDQIVPTGTPGSTLYAYYQLTNVGTTSNTGDIVASVVPSGTIQPVNSSTSPLIPVGGTFDYSLPNSYQVLTGTLPNSTDQGLALVFGNGGLAPGGVLDFKVSLDPSYSSSTSPVLTLLPPSTGVTTDALDLISYTPGIANGLPVVNTPEPVSLALWSALAAAGLIRARSFRKSQAKSGSADLS
jgi:hypothetical protein